MTCCAVKWYEMLMRCYAKTCSMKLSFWVWIWKFWLLGKHEILKICSLKMSLNLNIEILRLKNEILGLSARFNLRKWPFCPLLLPENCNVIIDGRCQEGEWKFGVFTDAPLAPKPGLWPSLVAKKNTPNSERRLSFNNVKDDKGYPFGEKANLSTTWKMIKAIFRREG